MLTPTHKRSHPHTSTHTQRGHFRLAMICDVRNGEPGQWWPHTSCPCQRAPFPSHSFLCPIAHCPRGLRHRKGVQPMTYVLSYLCLLGQWRNGSHSTWGCGTRVAEPSSGFTPDDFLFPGPLLNSPQVSHCSREESAFHITRQSEVWLDGKTCPEGRHHYSYCSRRVHRSPPSQGWARRLKCILQNHVSGLNGVGTEDGAGLGFIFLFSVL